MKKKLTAIFLCVALVAIAVVGASLAYFTDTDKATNTFAVGNVKIELIEQQRGENGLVPFEQNKKLYPIVGSAQGEKDEYGMSGENDLATLFPDIAAQWDTERNGSLRPDQITSFSNRKVWWRCTLGHEWQAIVAARAVENSGCPYCAGRRVLAGFNDLATLHPKIAAQWDSTLNSGLTPEMVTPGSHKRVWWKCAEGHVWKTAIYSRTGKQKCGCPVCAGKATRQVKYE